MSEEKKIDIPEEKSLFKNKSAAGKGDKPRNISRAFWDNWEKIDWGHSKKKNK